MTGWAGSIGSRPPIAVQHPSPLAVALPVQRRLGAGLLHELEIRGVGDRSSIDLEGGELDRVAGALVVVGEAVGRGADLVLAAGDRDHLGAVGRAAPRRRGRRRSGS